MVVEMVENKIANNEKNIKKFGFDRIIDLGLSTMYFDYTSKADLPLRQFVLIFSLTIFRTRAISTMKKHTIHLLQSELSPVIKAIQTKTS